MTTITSIDEDLLNSFVALSLLRTSSLDSVDKIKRNVHFKLTFTIKWKLKYKKKKTLKNYDVYTLPAFARAFFIFCFVFSFELFNKKEEIKM